MIIKKSKKVIKKNLKDNCAPFELDHYGVLRDITLGKNTPTFAGEASVPSTKRKN